eukprot:RCo043615
MLPVSFRREVPPTVKLQFGQEDLPPVGSPGHRRTASGGQLSASSTSIGGGGGRSTSPGAREAYRTAAVEEHDLQRMRAEELEAIRRRLEMKEMELRLARQKVEDLESETRLRNSSRRPTDWITLAGLLAFVFVLWVMWGLVMP